ICFFLVRLRFLGGSGDSSPHSPLDVRVRLAEDGEGETTTRLSSTTSGSSAAGGATLVSKERHVSVNHSKQSAIRQGEIPAAASGADQASSRSTTFEFSDAGRATLVSKERHVSVNHSKQSAVREGDIPAAVSGVNQASSRMY